LPEAGPFASGRDFAGVRTLSDSRTTGPRIVEDATCLGCACLCDDIDVVVDGDRIVEARQACEKGLGWYSSSTLTSGPGPTVGGVPVSLEQALDRAYEILRAARSPIVLGLEFSSIEAQRVVVAIADRIRAFVSVPWGEKSCAASRQRVGTVGATLGEIRDRADVIVYDTAFWPGLYPRFTERFVEPPGRFIPEGRAGRTIIQLRDDVSPDLTAFYGASAPDITVTFHAAQGYAVLRALLCGQTLDPELVEREVGSTLAEMEGLAERLKSARYGVMIMEPYTGWAAEEECVLSTVAELNRFTRFVAINLKSGYYNTTGAEAVLTWQAGAGGDVDFSLGYPRYLPDERYAGRRESVSADAALLVGDMDDLGRGAYSPASLAPIPRVIIASYTSAASLEYRSENEFADAEVVIPTAEFGIDEGGTVGRFDGVMLPVRRLLSGSRPSQAEVLRMLDERFRSGPACSSGQGPDR
jgi:formylmethanofuran dehydrogenase subunit B